MRNRTSVLLDHCTLARRVARPAPRAEITPRRPAARPALRARAQLLRPPDREVAVEPGQQRRHPVERADAHPQSVPPSASSSSASVGGRRDLTPLEWSDEPHLDLPCPRDTRQRGADVGDGVEPRRWPVRRPSTSRIRRCGRRGTSAGRRGRGRTLRGTSGRCAPRGHTGSARAPSAPLVRAIGRAHAPPSPDRVRELQHRVALHGRAGQRGRREPERGLERLDLPA